MSLYIDIEKQLKSFTLKVKFNQENNIIGFLGESGCGKSMTLKCIAGIETPTKGKIILNNRVLFDSEKGIDLPIQDRNVGLLFQDYSLFPHMTVRQNIEIGLLNLDKKDIREISNKYIDKFKLNELENRYPYQLSGGQSQRVALARVLATSPQILLLDEPFSALDYHLRRDMENELMDALHEYNKSSIFVTHDINEAYRVCDEILVYDNGRAKDKREVQELFNNPNSYMEAKLTGYKNISRIKKVDNNKFYTIDFGIEFIANKSCNNINYIAIRQENIQLTKDEKGLFKIKNIVENPFGYTIYIQNTKLNNKYIQVEIYKEKIKFKLDDIVNIKIENSKIIYF